MERGTRPKGSDAGTDILGVAPPSVTSPLHAALNLQRWIGNRSVGALLAGSGEVHISRKCAACTAGGSTCTSCSGNGGDEERARLGIHPKLTVSQPGDREEQEADRMAEAALRGSPPPRAAAGAEGAAV